MVFSDLFFLYVFIPCFALCYLLGALIDRLITKANENDPTVAIKPAMNFKNTMLILFSLIFYAWGEPVYILLMLGSVFINYIAGLLVNAYGKVGLTIGIVCNILILGVFKYAGFIATTLADCGVPILIPTISLPIGISFYTFQSISYLVDVYRKEAPVQREFKGLLLYISMFPQLIAGPIVRYNTVAQEINNRRITANDFADGLFRFLLGLGKKVILANQFSEIVEQFLGNGLPELTTSGAWLGILAFTMQIYFDFSGYSDMAIGLGKCMGFHFNENFDHPYCCNSITDFWRRWHISLGSFFRDYVYIPLGGNRQHQFLNILIVWFLTGMWHGASWNFIIWGVYFGIIVALEKYTILKLTHFIFMPFRHLYALALVVIGWGIFYFDDFSEMTSFFMTAFAQQHTLHNFVTESAITDKMWLWIAAFVFCLPVRKWAVMGVAKVISNETAQQLIYTICRIVVSLFMLAVSTALLVGATNNAFIYTRF
ncbi:MAG: MBOAT family protein [Prevotella sp.]|nr:MBOAT family protein [Prevotella sp.]